MGGNVIINGITADRISFDSDSLSEVWVHIRQCLYDIWYCYWLRYNEQLTDLSNGISPLLTGSSYHSNRWASKDEIDKIIYCEKVQSIGDVDFQVYANTKPRLRQLINQSDVFGPNTIFGAFQVVGHKLHGNELSALMLGKDDNVYQFDFQFVDDPGSDYQQFLHYSNWIESAEGIKGAHHKILLNAIGLDQYKFSITHGLRNREDDQQVAFDQYFDTLFPNAPEKLPITNSFKVLVEWINLYKTNTDKISIFDKFVQHTTSLKNLDSTRAIEFLRNNFGLR